MQTLKVLGRQQRFLARFLHINLNGTTSNKTLLSSSDSGVNVERRLHEEKQNVENPAYKQAHAYGNESSSSVDDVLKTTTYTGTKDKLMLALQQCSDYSEIFDLIESNADAMLHAHYVQTTIMLWKLLLVKCDDTTTISQHKEFDKFLTKLQAHIKQMDLHDLSLCYLYLRKLDVPNGHPLMSEMLMNALEMARNAESIELPTLSRLVVGVNIGKDFYIPLVCQYLWPHILSHVSTCNTAEAIDLLTISMLNTKRLICMDTMYALKQRVQQLLDDGILNAKTPKALFKLMQFFNIPVWSDRNTKLIGELLTLLQPTLTTLSDIELRQICQTFHYQLEPAALSDALRMETEARYQKHATLDALVNLLNFAKPTQRTVFIAALKDLLRSKDVWTEPNASSNFFFALRSLKVADASMCNMYWQGVIAELKSCATSDDRQAKFQRHAHNYMNFNNNLGGTYRNEELEKTLCNIAMRSIDGDVLASRIPSKFARIAAFVLGYGHTPYSWKKFPNIVISKLISMSEQFSIMDCFKISRGLQIAMEMRFRYQTPSIISMQCSIIDNILTSCAERHLNNMDDVNDMTISNLNAIVRTLAIRKPLRNSVVYQQALTKYGELDFSRADCLNSRIIRDMAFNFNLSSFVVPKALDAMCDYIERNTNTVSGDTVEKLLTLLYNLGYTPPSPIFLNHATAILMKDFEMMSGLSLIQACMALCYLNAMPDELIDKIFCAKFIQRVEDEVQVCYSKGTYPERVQNIIMQLNRTVCLDMPEMNVPWFQQNFIEAQLSKTRHEPNNLFKEEVKRLLLTILKGENFFHCNHTTPYGYQIDFVIYFDRDKKPITKPKEPNMLQHINKVAILLLKLDAFCENDFTMLRGVESLKIKHLEMMGYKVLHLSEHDWNSKYMSTIGVKLNYLKSLLQIADT